MVRHNSRKSATKQLESEIEQSYISTLSLLCQEADIWYRLQVLFYDLSNVARDSLSQERLSSTTNSLYISPPYFTDAEAIKIRTALIDVPLGSGESDEPSVSASISNAAVPEEVSKETSIEDAIHIKLEGFFEKRKASGDSTPCGPHDLFPVYANIFGVTREEINDERFLSRLRRSGIGDGSVRLNDSSAIEKSQTHKKGRKKG
ncbi:MAG: hypothetical protein MMC23_009199 [Stictis urceolatum]|nr:hypothetical protein [Stictis urceolata]